MYKYNSWYRCRIFRHFHFIDFEIWIRGLTFSKGNFLSRFQRFSCRRLRWKPSREWKAEYGKLLRLLRRWWKKKSAQRHEIKPRSTDFYVHTIVHFIYLFFESIYTFHSWDWTWSFDICTLFLPATAPE